MSQPGQILSVEYTQRIGIGADGRAERGSEIYLKEFKGMIDSGLMARIGNAAFKILHALGLRARVLGDPFYPSAEDEFQLLVRMEIVKPHDRGKLFCFVGREQIAEDTGIRSVNTVDAALDELVALRLIERLTPKQPHRFKDGTRSNRLRLHGGRFSSNYYIIREESYIRKFDHPKRDPPSADRPDSRQDQKSRVVNGREAHQDQKLILAKPTTRDSPALVNRALISTTTTTTTIGDRIDINSESERIAAFFAEAIGVERYDPTERETRRIATLLAEGSSLEDFGTAIQQVVEREKAKGKPVKNLAYCLPAVRDVRPQNGKQISSTQKVEAVRGVGTEAGAEKIVTAGGTVTPAETESGPNPPVVSVSNEHLQALAGADAEFFELLDLVQVKNPARKLDGGDARAWRKLADDFAALANERETSPISLVMQGVLEAIGANSDRDGFLAPNLVRRILERWQRETQTEKERALRSTDDSEAAQREPSNLSDQWGEVLKQMRAVMNPSDFRRLQQTLRVTARVDGIIRLQTSDPRDAEWVRDHVLDQLATEVAGVFGPGIAIDLGDSRSGASESTPGYAPQREGLALTAQDIWHTTLGELKLQMTKATFDTWVRPTRVLGWKDAVLFVQVHSPYAKAWFENRLQVTVQRTITGVVGSNVEVRYVYAGGSGAD